MPLMNLKEGQSDKSRRSSTGRRMNSQLFTTDYPIESVEYAAKARAGYRRRTTQMPRLLRIASRSIKSSAFLFAFATAVHAQPVLEQLTGKVVGVSDGDTLTVLVQPLQVLPKNPTYPARLYTPHTPPILRFSQD